MQKLYAVQFLTAEGKWEICQTHDIFHNAIATIFFSQHEAEMELQEWQKCADDDPARYRVSEIKVEGV